MKSRSLGLNAWTGGPRSVRPSLSAPSALILMSLLLVTQRAGADSPAFSALWGENGEHWRPDGRLPDFSFAGYHRGEKPLPERTPELNLKEFGGVGDGRTDDTEAFKKAIAAAKGRVLLVPPGRYRITDILYIRDGGTVLRGAGRDESILYFPNPLNDIKPNWGATTTGRRTSNYSWSGGFVWVVGSFATGELARVTTPAKRGDRSLIVSRCDELRVGDEIRLVLGDTPQNTLADHLYAGDPGPLENLKGRSRESFSCRITRVDPSRKLIELDRSLRTDVRPEWRPRLVRDVSSVEEVGIENLGFEFPTTPYGGHFTEVGYNALAMSGARNCWARSLRIRDADSGIFVSGTNITLREILIESDRQRERSRQATGHHGVTLGGQDNLLTDFEFRTRFMHDITVTRGSAGNVASSGRGVDLALDHHRYGPHANLFTDIDLGEGSRMFQSGGGARLGRHCAAYETFWCIRARRPLSWPTGWGPDLMNIVGVRSREPSITDPDGKWFEVVDPEKLAPRNLHRAQLARRLAGSSSAPGRSAWQDKVLAFRRSVEDPGTGRSAMRKWAKRLEEELEAEFPMEWDWALQDLGRDAVSLLLEGDIAALLPAAIRRVVEEVEPGGGLLTLELETLLDSSRTPLERTWLDLYVKACHERRLLRLKPLVRKSPRVVFTRHHNLGGSHYAYTEAQSDAQHERHFHPGASLCVLEVDGSTVNVETLLDDADGMIRDPAVSYDGKRILFAWKKSDRDDDFHLYEMDSETRTIRQLTFGLGFADYEGAYLPGGDIIFNSTRCVQTVDCWWTEVSNLYTCDRDGRYLRRLTFDQVHTNFPTVTADGRVLYTRWEYSDRGQIFPQPLFQMNPDGTGQTAFYGNNSFFPTSILHARGLPGSRKVVAVLAGHHTRQTGKLAIIDPARAREENGGVEEIAPPRETPAVRIDQYGQKGELFQYPYPLSETEFLVAYHPVGWERPAPRFKVFFMTAEGRRELLVADAQTSSNQPIPLRPREEPPERASGVDYRENTGTYYVQDVYEGNGLAGVPRGTVTRLRVVALRHRPAGIRSNRNRGPAGGALISTPVAIGNGSWDVKVVLGEARVYADGSAAFAVPARTPVYFQLVDAKGHVVQTMRSWSTLQPGEYFACTGCHEDQNQAAPARAKPTLAMRAGPQPLKPFYGPARGFSFAKEIQPILDRWCIRCHDDRTQPRPEGRARSGSTHLQPATTGRDAKAARAFSLLGTQTAEDSSGRRWSDAYLALTQAVSRGDHYFGRPESELVNWISTQSAPTMLPPYHAGSGRSGLMTLLEEGHGGVDLSREELEKIACWIDLLVPYCGDYAEAHAWADDELAKYEHFLEKRRRMESIERRNIEQLVHCSRSPE